jgi:methylated-DNA-[protein]-cysteine S-methyltransferase
MLFALNVINARRQSKSSLHIVNTHGQSGHRVLKICDKENGMITYIEHSSPLGVLLIAASDLGISGIYFDEHRHFKGKDGWLPVQEKTAAARHLTQAARQLDEYFAGRRTAFDVPLDLSGTDFQQAVWRQLGTIPFGASISYAQHAKNLDKPKAMRAVGAAI